MQSYINEGDVLDHVLAADTAGNTPLLLTDIVAITVHTGKAGDVVPVRVHGIFKVAKETGTAWTIGKKIYWDDTAKLFTHTVGSNKQAGVAAAAAQSADAVGQVKLLY